jgi:chromosome partitioning protein
MNDSFVDFDMLGTVDPVTLELTKPSLYSLTVWEGRKQRAMSGQRQAMDWVVLRNRLATTEARNRKRLEDRLTALAKRVGFRIGPGLRDRVIYRELFPFGLTIADLSPQVRPVPVSLQHLAARQELRALMHSLGLAAYSGETLLAAQ